MNCTKDKCNGQLGYWSEGGMTPSQKIFRRQCKKCGQFSTLTQIINSIIKKNRKQLQRNKELNRSWPNSIDLIKGQISGLGGSYIREKIVSRLVSHDLY